jgi:hypothetical protein
VRVYGRTVRVHAKVFDALWYSVGHGRLMRFAIIRGWPGHKQDHVLCSTDTTRCAEQIIEAKPPCTLGFFRLVLCPMALSFPDSSVSGFRTHGRREEGCLAFLLPSFVMVPPSAGSSHSVPGAAILRARVLCALSDLEAASKQHGAPHVSSIK